MGEGRSRKAGGGAPTMLAAKTSRRRRLQLQRVLLKHRSWSGKGQMVGVARSFRGLLAGWGVVTWQEEALILSISISELVLPYGP